MFSIVLSICFGIFAVAVLVLMTMGTGTSKRVSLRLAALDQEFAPTDYEEQITDIRRDQKRLSAIPWLNRWLTRMNLASASSLYLYQAGVTVSFGTLLVTSVAGSAALGCALFLRFGAILPALLLSAAFLPSPF